ncbi:hypothetical protein M2146_002523 [Lachnospiraceae bacterium PF1-22]
MNRFTKENSLIINLPVPLGTEVYVASSDCGGFCMYQEKYWNTMLKEFPYTGDGGSRCGFSQACHTINPHVTTTSVELANLLFILNEWDKRVFSTKNEAFKAAEDSVAVNRKKMKELGFFIDADGDGDPTSESK